MIKRKGFTLIELTVSLIIISVVWVGFLKFLQIQKEENNVNRELAGFEIFQNAIKRNFITILNDFQPVCSNIPTDATSEWGWSHASCKNTSPFPVLDSTNGGRKIKYNIDFNSLAIAKQNELKADLEKNFNGVCSLNSSSNSDIILDCPKITNLQYDTGAGFSTASPHTLGSDIDPSVVPMVRVTYDRVSEIGSFQTTDDLDFTLNDLYTYRRNITINKLDEIKTAMKAFHDGKLAVEFQTPPPGALHSMDDEMVPWFWQIFGDKVDTRTTYCIDSGSGVCNNLDNNNYWRTSGLSYKGLYMRRIAQNLFSGDLSHSIDGFGNKIMLYPFAEQCTTNDLSTCSVTRPPVPQRDYYKLGAPKPPFTTVLYTKTSSLKNQQRLDYERIYFTY